jgi:cytochrome c553
MPMRYLIVRAVGAIGVACLSFVGAAVAQKGSIDAPNRPAVSVPVWAFPWDSEFKVPPVDDVLHRLPGSAATFSSKQARDLFFSPDWHAENHPAMPEVVSAGRKPDVRACGSCHRAEGTGGPENASLAGLPASYIVQQMADMKSGARQFSGPRRSAILLMTAAAKAATDAEVQAAATYFSALKPKPLIKVVESNTVPKTYIARLFFVKSENGGTEPLGQRIIEMPDDVEQFELRDSQATFTAYVPVGSVAKGETLVNTGGSGATVPCAICHGADLKGVAAIPGIAGRSPSYVARQLYDFKNSARAGGNAALMKPTVANLSEEDIISLAAYVASLKP